MTFLLLLTGSAATGTPPTPPSKAAVGWPNTLRRKAPREAIERLLELQKNATFGRHWFAEFEAAQEEFAQADAKAAVQEAAKEAREVAEVIHEQVREDEFEDALRNVAVTLQVVASVKSSRDALETATHAAQMARALKRLVLDDEETIEILLLH